MLRIIILCSLNILSVLAVAASQRQLRTAKSLAQVDIHADHVDGVKQDIAGLMPYLSAGGQQARKALAHLHTMTAEPEAIEAMKAQGVEAAIARLMKSRASSEDVQGLAGSLATILTNMPVTSEIADEQSGSYGQVHITLPRPSRVYAGEKSVLEHVA